MYHIDFETCSPVNLKEAGVHVYAAHPDTQVWCMGWAKDEDEPQIWTPNQPMPSWLEDPTISIVAHNATFELAILKDIMSPRYGWPEIKLHQVECTMAMAYAMGFPGSLDGVSAALGLDTRKDKAGAAVMKKLSVPAWRGDGTSGWLFPDDSIFVASPEDLRIQYEYCKQDVRVEKNVYKHLRRLCPYEQAVWRLDQTINNRGLLLDTEAIRGALEIVDHDTKELRNQLIELTEGQVQTPNQQANLIAWLASKDVVVSDLTRNTVAELLEDTSLDPTVKKVLRLRQRGSKTSTAKLETMLTGVNEDGRARGLFQYHAAATGRFAGRRVQPQNMPRPKTKNFETIVECINVFKTPCSVENRIQLLKQLTPLEPTEIVSDCLRSFILATPGNEFLVADYSNIEGRGLAWLAGEERKLQAFRNFDAGKGQDIYLITGALIANVPVETLDKRAPERQVGKVAELACGYQGGVGAFQKMAALYNVVVADEKADEIKSNWRRAHPNIVTYWKALERAAIAAIDAQGNHIYSAGLGGRKVYYKMQGPHLCCKLPSGRLLCYPYAKMVVADTQFGPKRQIEYHYVDQVRRTWVQGNTYGGSLCENVTQAVCRDILVAAMLRLEENGYPVYGHVHDEIICEVPIGKKTLAEMEALMCVPPVWAKDFPIVSSGWQGTRYQKGD